MRFEKVDPVLGMFCGMIKERFPDMAGQNPGVPLRSIFPEMEKAAPKTAGVKSLLAKYKEELKKTMSSVEAVIYFENDGVAGCGLRRPSGLLLLFFYSIVKRSIKHTYLLLSNGEKTAPVLY
ncbi:hypothetical protein SPFM8_00206 [Salmonella phage SPFM8]|nr:hypothetical protein SPFM8_00206 [Salmonella phage SPFM8]